MKNWQRIFSVTIVVLFVLGAIGTATAGTLEDIMKRGELRVACQTQGPPFSFVDRNGERAGSSIEVAKLIAKEMGVKIKFLSYDWDGLIPALLSKKADMLAADMTPTLKRAMKISFVDPYMYTGSVVFVKQDSSIKTIADVKAGTKIAVLLGAAGENDAKKAFPDATLKSYKGGGPLLINAVMAGHTDAGVNDGSAAILVMSRERADELGLEVLASIVGMTSIAIKPDRMAEAPGFAMKKVFDMADLTIDDMDVCEINEAFATVPLVSIETICDKDKTKAKKLQKKFNINGSAVAIGHANTASGARIMMNLIYELRRRGGGYAAGAICGGLAQADACILKV